MATISLQEKNIDSLPLQQRKLEILVRCNPYDKHSESLLLNYYLEIRETWTKSAIDSLRSKYSLNLKKKADRCFLANLAAKLTLKGYSETSVDLLGIGVDRRTTQEKEKLTVNAIAALFSHDRINPSFNDKMLLNNSNSNADTKELYPRHLNKTLQVDQEDYLRSLAIEDKVEQLEAELLSKQKELEAISQQLEERSQQLQQEFAQRICLERQLEASNNQLNKQVKLNIIVATDRLLPAGPPLNGVEKSPMLAIMGSPATFTQLEHNYQVLEAKWLGIVTKYHEWIKDLLLGDEADKYWNQETIDFYCQRKTDAMKRLDLIKSIYNLHKNNWNLLKPTIPISDEEYTKRMNAEIPNGWTAASFWD